VLELGELQREGDVMTRTCIIIATAVALTLSLAVAGSAQARGTISYDGTTMTFTGDGGADQVGVGPSQGELAWTTSGLDAIPPQCARAEYVDSTAYCPWPQKIVVQLGGGNDGFSVGGTAWDPFPANVVVESSGDDGDDRLQGGNTQHGGAGNDTLEGHDGNQALYGGPGDDNVNGLLGSDQVFGEEGNDHVSGDGHKESASPDLIDGGPGVDIVDDDWETDGSLAVTLGGGADDGRAGEGDDVRNVEQTTVFAPGRFVGTEGADRIEVVQVDGPSELIGGGGNDLLKTSDGTDRLDGGAGADTIDGGYGDDTLVGGPGPDQIAGDHPGGECGIYWCKLPAGNDTIEARDGEQDSVTCGAGADTVNADPADTVAPDCETINRGTAITPDDKVVTGRCVVPTLRGLTAKKAKAKLKKAGCKAKIRRKASRRVRRGRVIAQGTKAGKRLKGGATVKLTVSRGR
jgi:Ca2+-binding RTX toxin-like protein